MKKMMLLVFLSVFLFSPLAFAEMAVEAGNTVCPISGDKVTGKDFVEHAGKKYGICCAMCADKFKKNPEKYIAEMSAASESHEGHDHSM